MSAHSNHSQPHSSPLHSPNFIFWGAMLIACLLILLGASGGVRGSDQYWYLADLKTLLNGEPHFNNTLFPRQLLGEGLQKSPFIHDILIQYLAVPFAWIAGPYPGWILMNVGAVILAGCLTRKTIAMSADALTAARISAWMVLLPVNIHQGSQMLAETACMPFFAAVIFLIHRANRPSHWLVISAFGVLLLMARFTHVCVLITIPFLVLFQPWPVRRRIITWMASLFIAAGGYHLNKILFTGVILTGGGLGPALRTHGMTLAYQYDKSPLTPGDVIDKILFSLSNLLPSPFSNQTNLAINYVLLLLAVAGAFIAWKRRHTATSLILLATVAMNVATLLLFQNQFRYVLPSIPLLTVGAAFLLDSPTSRTHVLFHRLFPWVVAGLVAGGWLTGIRNRNAGLREADERAQLALLNQTMQGPGDVLAVDHEWFIFSYSVAPRITLFTESTQPSADWDRILAMPRWRWVFCTEGQTQLFDQRHLPLKSVHQIELRGFRCALYEIIRPPLTAPSR